MGDPAGSLSPVEIEKALAQAFTPHAPVQTVDLFAGRKDQFRACADVLQTVGLHALVFGDRGLGKTSLANVIGESFGTSIPVGRVSCAQSDTFSTSIRRGLDALAVVTDRPVSGFGARRERFVVPAGEMLAPGDLTPGGVADLLASLPSGCLLIVDEFDRLPMRQTGAYADLLKALSDMASTVTVLLVGKAESVDRLLENHASVARCLRQIRLPRMTPVELDDIVRRGCEAAGFELESDEPVRRIVAISQGFPHYTHLLGLYAARSALDAGRMKVTADDVDAAVHMALAHPDWHEDYLEQYLLATSATKRDNLWMLVVTACALADADERGAFTSRAVVEELGVLAKKAVRQQSIAFHLGKLTEKERGPLLERSGAAHQYRYRFLEPMMRPYILLRSAADQVRSDPEPVAVGQTAESGTW